MSQIPVTKEYAEAAGRWCERVENRSLLLEKFALPKNWGDSEKEHSASAWSLMRVSSNGQNLLEQARQRLEKPGQNVRPEKAEAMLRSAKTVAAMKRTRFEDLDKIRQRHSLNFLALLRKSYPEDRLVIIMARLEGRLAINLAEGVIQNAGISLDRIFGLPLIPGSAVKGVVRSAAHWDVKAHPEKRGLFNRVFGTAKSKSEQTDDCAGAITFLPATPCSKAEIVVDITNVHYPEYYRTGDTRALAKERPQPNQFPVVERGAEFAFPLLLNGLDNDPALLAAAKEWLVSALTEYGVGAKTAAGYGWFSIVGEADSPAENDLTETKPDEATVAEIKGYDPKKLAETANQFKSPYVFDTLEKEKGSRLADPVFQRSLLEVLTGLETPSKGQKQAMKALKGRFGIS